ncbi:(6-4)DNA photolyase [Prunus yedoensis var. nudiflora]|uniref:(6-4)DNA photolyase n=1 Tax=Prunus yedoensis var. nudiflora TaxID=2094558 RepID=A0A314ZIH5_PRUYE|nr:(6-4)DNA photolyase [Prunus yedoensis var. nudiflora]
MSSGSGSLMWFRKGLRIHDNPALEYASKGSNFLYPVFVIDPHYMKPDPEAFSPGSSKAGLNRIQFLLESLRDLDLNLKRLGSRLLVLKGEPSEVLIRCLKEWDVKNLCFEYDTEPYYQALDVKVKSYATTAGIEIYSPVSHTLFNPADIIRKNGGKPPLSYQSFLKLAGEPSWVSSPLSITLLSLPPVGNIGNCNISEVPTVKRLGYEETQQDELSPFRGGETEALKRLRESIENKEWVAKFEKPKGDPSAFSEASNNFVMARLFLHGGIWHSPSFDRMRGEQNMQAETDADWASLRKWGWMHHLARHSVACFLTRGDLFCHWEKGRVVFERLLIDSDWAIINGNWLWLSCSSFFYQYNRIYSPISFGKKYDPNGDYIRHFLPVLKGMPKEYIYEPWTAPLSIQNKAKCIIGRDYPKPVVAHDSASKDCRRRMAEAYALNQKMSGMVSAEDLRNLRRKLEEDQKPEVENKRQRKLIG